VRIVPVSGRVMAGPRLRRDVAVDIGAGPRPATAPHGFAILLMSDR